MPERLFTRFRDSGTIFDTMGGRVAWRGDNPLEAWQATNPEPTGGHAVNP
ncbi:MAG: hypothetical protein P8Y92_04355 [Halioglobus sp.]|jgi:hypothetical protein